MDRLSSAASGAGRPTRPLALLGVLLAAGCGGRGGDATPVLVDGSKPEAMPSALEKLGNQAVMTRARVVSRRSLDPGSLRECLRTHRPAVLAPGERVVVRTGVLGASITFRGRPRGWLRGCDASAGSTESGGRWCGAPIGRLRPDGSLYDRRLNILCRDSNGDQIGFAWIDPLRKARYVVVQDAGPSEIYEVVSGLPVRLTTSDVRVEGSSATFHVEQYTAAGRRLSEETIRVTVAG